MPRQPRPWLPVALLTALCANACAQAQPLARAPGNGEAFTPYRLANALLAPHTVTIFPATSAVSVSGFAPGTWLQVELLRPDATTIPFDPLSLVSVARARGEADLTGSLRVNQRGGTCWIAAAPAVLAGDIVRITPLGSAYEETRTAAVTCGTPLIEQGQLTLHGVATDGFGNPLPLEQLEARLTPRSGTFTGGVPLLKATGTATGPSAGTLSYDARPVTPGAWTAAFTGVNANDTAKAATADAHIVWLGTNPQSASEVTDFVVPAFGGAAKGCLSPIGNAITSSDHPTITPDNAHTDLVLGGTAGPDVTALELAINGGAPLRVPLPPTTVQKAWSASVPASRFGPSPDGGLVARATFFLQPPPPTAPVATMQVPAATAELVMPPDGPTTGVYASPAGGTYDGPVAVELVARVPGERIYYTTDGSEPGLASPRYAGVPLAIDRPTTLKLCTQRLDGTLSPVLTQAYVLGGTFYATAFPRGGTYDVAKFVNLTANRPATIRYTLDGRTPGDHSPVAGDNPVLIAASAVLRFVAIDANGQASAVGKEAYTIQDTTAPSVVALPSKPLPGITRLGGPSRVRLAASEQAQIFYTTDGTDPTPLSRLYTPPGILLTPPPALSFFGQTPLTLKFMAIDLAGNRSAVVTALYN